MVKDQVKFKRICIYSSLDAKKIEHISKQLEEILKNLKLDILIPKSFTSYKTVFGKYYSDSYIVKNADLIIAIGGDGTLLSSARKFGYSGVPVLGVNLGSLGFLTDVPPEELTISIQQILLNQYEKEERFFLESKVNQERTTNKALNEVVVHSKKIAQLMEYELFINNRFVYRQKADGLIISTPTGSTAYSLSANGPIIHPLAKAICLLPMFPHSLNSRPLIVDDSAKIEIRVCNKVNACLSLDSHLNKTLKDGDVIKVSKANSRLSLIHPLDHDFFSSCRNKLGWSLGVPKRTKRR